MEWNLWTMILFTPIPLLLLLDVAATSSSCDMLMDTLNDVRIKHQKPAHLQIEWLETALARLHHGQGLGFQIGGLVIDNRTLRNAVIAIVGGLTTVVTTLLALSDDLERLTPFNNSQCELTSAQLDAMRTMAVAFANEKGSENCEYANITLADLLRP